MENELKHITLIEDLREKSNLQFNSSLRQNPWELLASCEYKQFRFLMTTLPLKHIAILIFVNNNRLTDRIFLHLSDEALDGASELLGRMNVVSEEEKQELLMQINLESLFQKNQ